MQVKPNFVFLAELVFFFSSFLRSIPEITDRVFEFFLFSMNSVNSRKKVIGKSHLRIEILFSRYLKFNEIRMLTNSAITEIVTNELT